MKNQLKISGVILVLIIIFLMHSCKKEKVPTLTTYEITNITGTTATCGGTITSEGSSAVISRGVCWSTEITPTIADNKTIDGAGAGSFSSNITGLSGATTYYLRAYSTNRTGTGYGTEMSFTTYSGLVPAAATLAATTVFARSATLNGTANANYLNSIVTFEYGTTSSYGIITTAAQSPVTGNKNTQVSAYIFGLNLNTTYHFRIKVVNELGTTYGSDMNFTTKGEVTDIDGNVYNTITYGNQEIMDENLKAIRYNDATPLPNITDNASWLALTTGAYSDYGNNPSYSAVNGRLYNWYAVASTNPKNVCPVGWHVLNSEASWCLSFASPYNFKSIGFGIRSNDGSFVSIGNGCAWWNSYTWIDTTYAWNLETSYGSRMSFCSGYNRKKNYGLYVRCIKGDRIPDGVPSVTTSPIKYITMTSAMSGGIINSYSGSSVYAKGVCWSLSHNPTIADSKTIDGTNTGSFTSNITGLTISTTYYLRAYGSSAVGTGYGEEIQFTTTDDQTGQTGTVTDLEGNKYKTVGIGSQIWMAENLKATKYNDGTDLPNITDNMAWIWLGTGAYCDYNNNPANSTVYGRLYNGYAVFSNNLKNVCPTGWHVPTDTEWTILTTFLGGEQVAGGKLKEAGIEHWDSPNVASNETGFTALPGGNRYANATGNFQDMGCCGFWWSSDVNSYSALWARTIWSHYSFIFSQNTGYVYGMSVRCLKGN